MSAIKKELIEDIRAGRVLTLKFNDACNIKSFRSSTWESKVKPALAQYGLERITTYNPDCDQLQSSEVFVSEKYNASCAELGGMELEVVAKFKRPDPAKKPEFGYLKEITISFFKDVPIFG